MTKIQLLKRNDYWTQLKNLDTPVYECQVTSGANALNALGIYPYTGKYRLPDVIDDVAMGAIAKAWAKSLNYAGPPRELHEILAWAINVVAGKELDHFVANATMQKLFFEVAQKRPVIVAGDFTSAGHVVVLTGMITDQIDIFSVQEPHQVDLSKIHAGLICDPYGDWHTKQENGGHYAPGSIGYECEFTIEELNQILHSGGLNSKYAHLFQGTV